jgi:hypothetical protein
MEVPVAASVIEHPDEGVPPRLPTVALPVAMPLPADVPADDMPAFVPVLAASPVLLPLPPDTTDVLPFEEPPDGVLELELLPPQPTLSAAKIRARSWQAEK